MGVLGSFLWTNSDIDVKNQDNFRVWYNSILECIRDILWKNDHAFCRCNCNNGSKIFYDCHRCVWDCEVNSFNDVLVIYASSWIYTMLIVNLCDVYFEGDPGLKYFLYGGNFFFEWSTESSGFCHFVIIYNNWIVPLFLKGVFNKVTNFIWFWCLCWEYNQFVAYFLDLSDIIEDGSILLEVCSQGNFSLWYTTT